MRRLDAQGWPELSAAQGGAELVRRWEALLGKTPRLRPWLGEMLGQKRLVLQQTGAADVERILWDDLARWLQDFEALPHFAIAAIATTLQEDRTPPAQADADDLCPADDSPERAVTELHTLLGDPAFALAFHCVEARIKPALPVSAVPEAAWFGLLHASSPADPRLTAQVAVALVLRVLSAPWARAPSAARQAALRLFHARPADVRGDLSRVCAALPREWSVIPEEFVAASTSARVAFAEACALCARFVAAVRTRLGGLAVIECDAAPASPAELAELARTARKYGRMGGFQRLLALL
jgi:hypothetical protein